MSVFRYSMAMAENERGHCMSCRHWQAENEEAASAAGLCMQPELTHFSIQLTAHSGCNRFEHVEAGEMAAALSGA